MVMNEWYCRKCKSHVRAHIKTEIWRAPQLLMVQLKRFTHSNASGTASSRYGGGGGYYGLSSLFRSRGLGEKLNTLVKFPVQGLDLSDIVACKGWSDDERGRAVRQEAERAITKGEEERKKEEASRKKTREEEEECD